MKNDFNLCPMCGSKNIQNKNDRKWFCPDCGFDLYCNVAASVGVLIFDDDNNFLFEKRAKEPKKGLLTQPGGFIDADESAEAAVARECREELGAEVTDINYLGSYPNTYEYKKITYKTCDMFFTARLSGCKNLNDFAKHLNRQESEVEEIVIQKISSISDVDSLPLAFDSTRNALKDFFTNGDGAAAFDETEELLWI
jgi:ADP-ribose pyrophosphatase YjhB (NUDIX family)